MFIFIFGMLKKIIEYFLCSKFFGFWKVLECLIWERSHLKWVKFDWIARWIHRWFSHRSHFILPFNVNRFLQVKVTRSSPWLNWPNSQISISRALEWTIQILIWHCKWINSWVGWCPNLLCLLIFWSWLIWFGLLCMLCYKIVLGPQL